MMHVKLGDFVFWEYNHGFLPMTYLAGVVTHVHEDGRVRVQGYGTMTFKPIHVTDVDTGQALFNKLKTAEQRLNRMVNDAKASFTAARDSLFKKG